MKQENFKKEVRAVASSGLVIMFITALVCLDSKAGAEATKLAYSLLGVGATGCLGLLIWVRN